MSYSSEVLADSPKVYYKLDDSSGTTAVDAVAANNATYRNSPTLAQSPLITVGTAILLAAASSQDVAMPSSGTVGFGGGGGLSVEAWIKTSQSGTGNPQIVCADVGSGTSRVFQLRLSTTGKLEWIVFKTTTTTGDLIGGTTINDGAVHHVVGTWDQTTAKVYVDGVSDATGLSASGTVQAGTGAKSIGSREHGGPLVTDSFFDGIIDEVAIYRTALSAARVLAHYNAGLAAASGIKTIMGVTYPTNVKTVDGLAQASVKTVVGIS